MPNNFSELSDRKSYLDGVETAKAKKQEIDAKKALEDEVKTLKDAIETYKEEIDGYKEQIKELTQSKGD
jgi:chromosome segregation ATPase